MIACLTITYFATAIERRHDDRLSQQPLVLGGQPWEPRPLYAYSQEVAQRGVAPGMSLRLAHTLSPQAQFLPAAPDRYCAAAGEIVDLLTDFTPLLEAEALWQTVTATPAQQTPGGRRLPARYYLDLERLPLAEALPLTQEMGRQLRRQTRLAAAVGLAAGKFAAQVAASLARPNHIRPVAAEQEKAFLAACPVTCLPLDRETARQLRQLGVQTLGQLAALPAGGLKERFGPALASYWQLAPDQEQPANGPGQQLRPATRPNLCRVSLRFPTPQDQPAQLAAAVPRLAQALADRLQAGGLSGRTLRLGWQTEKEHVPAGGSGDSPAGDLVELALRRPTATAPPLAAALRQLLQQSGWCGLAAANIGAADIPSHTGAGIVRLTAVLTHLSPTTAQQLPLFPAAAAADQLSQTVTNLAARHSTAHFYRPALPDPRHPLPERRFALTELQPA
jgi:nucleotidyltransferase/DNA polymerase involved in DNA repair